ncbi:MAG TPA: 2Fe-2S iron-sulfur cluster-binding protein [Trebonia sp.]|nr:2Fe-2S iron-sulfur cluster-binding protein [Trebonia sp.]
MNEIALHVNGVLHRLTVDPRTSLLDLLRERLGLTGSKKGCYHGQCGACTALIDGRRANACLALAVAHDGMTMGLGMALMEQTVVDAAQGGFVRRDLAQYHIATCADVQDVDAVWLEETDPHLNPMGAKGIGEIGITGTAAAIGNAIYHATGRRVRDLPITPAKLLTS